MTKQIEKYRPETAFMEDILDFIGEAIDFCYNAEETFNKLYSRIFPSKPTKPSKLQEYVSDKASKLIGGNRK